MGTYLAIEVQRKTQLKEAARTTSSTCANRKISHNQNSIDSL